MKDAESVAGPEPQFPGRAKRHRAFKRFAITRFLFRRVTQLLINCPFDKTVVLALDRVEMFYGFWGEIEVELGSAAHD